MLARATTRELESSRTGASSAGNSLATLRTLLRGERKRRGLSQMELALRLGFSPRHISFVEIGRARPSRMLIERWLAEVEAQPSIRSAALLHAGFAPRPDASDEPPCGPAANRAEVFDRLLAVHEPFPAFVFDADWYIRKANRAARWLMSVVMPGHMSVIPSGRDVDMLAACADPAGLLSTMIDAESFADGHLGQLELEASANPRLQRRLAALTDAYQRRFGRRPIASPDSSGGQTTFCFSTPFGQLEFFRFQSLVDLPQDVTLQSHRVEVSLPLTERTRRVMRDASVAFARDG